MRHLTSDNKHQTSCIRHQTSEIIHQTSHITRVTSDNARDIKRVWNQTSDFLPFGWALIRINTVNIKRLKVGFKFKVIFLTEFFRHHHVKDRHYLISATINSAYIRSPLKLVPPPKYTTAAFKFRFFQVPGATPRNTFTWLTISVPCKPTRMISTWYHWLKTRLKFVEMITLPWPRLNLKTEGNEKKIRHCWETRPVLKRVRVKRQYKWN